MSWLGVTFTVTNNSSSEVLLTNQNQYFVVQPGNGQVINEPLTAPALPDRTGCDPSADLRPGAHSDPQCVVVGMTPAQAAEPLKFIWKVATSSVAAGGTIDLGGVPIQ